MKTIKLTVAQAIIRFLKNQYVERDGIEHPFFAGCAGIFGHGNLAGFGQALKQDPGFPYIMVRNEQAAVHMAAGYAKMKNRLSTFVCTSSIGPGATNMISGAAAATINRLPVLLLPGDIFGQRTVAPVLQQLESPLSQDISVNDCFKPVSKYWDRIYRPEQIMTALPEVMRVLTSPSNTGCVTLSVPQDVQTEAFDFPDHLFEKRIWHISRPPVDPHLLKMAADWIISSSRPIIVSGGGVIYSEAEDSLLKFIEQTGVPVIETFAGKGALPYNHPLNLGAAGATGTEGANYYSERADLVIGIGTRYSDFTTASKTAFQNEKVRFININVAEFDAYKHSALALTGDARAVLDDLAKATKNYATDATYQKEAGRFNLEWDQKVEAAYLPDSVGKPSQSEVIGAVNEFSDPEDVLVCASGSLPGDLHKLWRTRNSKGFHLEYGYSCMGYEFPGALGVKMAAPEREVYVMLGDGGYLMMPSEIITSLQEDYKLTVILINNQGFASIGGLSRSIGGEGFGTNYKYRDKQTGQLDGDLLPVDLATNAESLGAKVFRTSDVASFKAALSASKKESKTTVIYIETVPERKMAGYGSAWWDVPIAEVSTSDSVKQARENYIDQKRKQRHFL